MEQEYKEAFLMSVSSSLEADFIESQLKFYGIPVLKKYNGMGGYITIVTGNSNLGVDLFVPESALEAAKDILAAEPEPIKEYYSVTDDNESNKGISSKNSRIALITVIFAVLLIIVYVFMTIVRLMRI